MKYLLILFVLLFSFLYYSEVDNSITNEDKKYIQKISDENSISLLKSKSYEEEITQIKLIQKSIFEMIPHNLAGIPLNSPREIKDYYNAKRVQCHDRSRVIEKFLRLIGYETRHVSIYKTNETSLEVLALVTPGVGSHSFTEVKTKKGWLIIESTNLDNFNINNSPISISELRDNPNLNLETNISRSYKKDYYYIYGLYSRHGRFYPPYNKVPDIEWKEFLYNITVYFE